MPVRAGPIFGTVRRSMLEPHQYLSTEIVWACLMLGGHHQHWRKGCLCGHTVSYIFAYTSHILPQKCVNLGCDLFANIIRYFLVSEILEYWSENLKFQSKLYATKKKRPCQSEVLRLSVLSATVNPALQLGSNECIWYYRIQWKTVRKTQSYLHVNHLDWSMFVTLNPFCCLEPEQ